MINRWQINDFIPDPASSKDRWQIFKIIPGGMGVVYIVYDSKFREVLAVKTYLDKLKSLEAQERFKREANIWINLERHENIAYARFVEKIYNHLYIFLEYVPSGDLSRWIGTKSLDLKQVLLFSLQFCYGMEHANKKGMKAHRDIKPQNCLITDDRKLKITDFGLAKALDFANNKQELSQPITESILYTRTGQWGGTLPYMAPEQFEDFKHVDIKADIYAFGIVLYEMICKHLPFLGNSYAEFREKHQKAPIPNITTLSCAQARPLADIVQKCLAKMPWERYADFRSLRKELTQLYEDINLEAPPSPQKIENLSATDLFNKGNNLIIVERYNEAISCFEDTLEINPKLALAWSGKGTALVSLRDFEEAIICFENALKIDPKSDASWVNKGIALSNLRRHEEAKACYDRAISINPKSPNTWYIKGIEHGKLGQYKKAIKCYNQALKIDAKEAKFWSAKGVIFEILERHEEAIICYNHALEIDPKNIEIWYNKGVSCGKLGRHKEAIACYDQALKINPQFAEAWYNKSSELFSMGENEKSLTCLEKSKELGLPQAAEAIEKLLIFLGIDE